MKNKLFISHSTYDKEVVEVLSNLIRRVSLNQISIWFSNDTKEEGVFFAGDNWFESILSNLKSSGAVISFITPNSNNKPWILYESGYAEALNDTLLIPLKFLINVNEISIPLQQKQIFGFSNIEEANVTLRKVLGVFNISFDEEVFRDIIIKGLNEMRTAYKSSDNSIVPQKDSIEILSDKIENYFNMMLNFNSLENENGYYYEIAVEYTNKLNRIITEYIKIDNFTTVSNVLDEIYFILDGQVRAYRYLEEWILKETESKRFMVISDVQDLVPAKVIFKPNSKWKVIFLENPYVPNNKMNAIKNSSELKGKL